MPLNLMDLLAHGLNNIYYHFDSAANLESKDFFSVFFLIMRSMVIYIKLIVN